MKIIEAQKIYLANRSVLVEQKKTLTSQRDKAKKMAELTGDSAYSDEAASLELTLKETEDKFLNGFLHTYAVHISLKHQHISYRSSWSDHRSEST